MIREWLQRFKTKQIRLMGGPCHGLVHTVHRKTEKLTISMKDGGEHVYLISNQRGYYRGVNK